MMSDTDPVSAVPSGADSPGKAAASVSYDADAWATACAEDVAEQASQRRVSQAYQPGSAVDELRKFAGSLADKVQELGGPMGLPAQLLLSQAKTALGQARDRNPDLFDHLAAAGSELLAAYRAAVTDHERRWTGGDSSSSEHIDLD
jgi:Family of unknown function (DUF5304)